MMKKTLDLFFGLLLLLCFSTSSSGQAINLSEVCSFLLRGTNCGAATSFPTYAASVTTWNAPLGRLIVPESLMSDFLGDVTVIQASNATIPSTAGVNEIFKVGEKLQQDVDANASNLKFRIHIPGSGEQDFVDSNQTVIDYLKQKWFVDQQVWPITDSDQQTQRVKDAINFLRGKHNLEQENSGPFRDRKYVKQDSSRPLWALGEVYGKPVVVGPPGMPYTELDYEQFSQANANRASALFFGGGDGMIHVVYYDGTDAAMKGRHVYLMIPSVVVPQLGEYTKPDYTRNPFVEGPLEAFDIHNGTQWKTMLLASLSHGGKSITALDITDPVNPSLQFEFSHEKLGYSYSPAIVGRFLSNTSPGKKYYFLIGSGFENSDQRAYLIAIDPAGNLVTSVQIPNDSDQPAAANGTMSIASFDSNADGLTDSIYIGTYQGQVYRIDTPGSETSSWSSPVLIADFSPLNITASARITKVQGKTYVFIGTGKLLGSQDIEDVTQQYFTAFEDSGSTITLSSLDRYASNWVNGATRRFVQLTTLQDIENEKGYAIQLPDQHKFVNPALLLADGILFTTIDPKIEENTPCTAPSGKSVVWYISQTGNPLFSGNPDMDVDADGILETEDVLNGKSVAGAELISSSFYGIPNVEFSKAGLKVHTIQFYSEQLSGNMQYAKLETISIRNRFKLRSGKSYESSTAK